MAAAALCLWSLPADAFFVKPVLKQTRGSRHYVSSTGSVDFGTDDLHFKPSVTGFRSDDSTGTFKTYEARATYAVGKYEVALTGGFSPRVNGYANRFLGLEGSTSFEFEKGAPDRPAENEARDEKTEPSKRKFAISRVDLSGGITKTEHSDEFSGTINKKGQLVLVRSTTSTLDVGQTDFEGTIGIDITAARLEADLTKSVYNKDIARVGARAAQVTQLSGLTSTVQGFPDLNANARVDLQLFEAATPWFSYTYTTYKVQQPNSRAGAVGVDAVPVDGLSLTASFQRVVQAGQPTKDYVTLQAGYRFE